MPDKGTYVPLDTKSVRGSADKTIPFVKNMLVKVHERPHTVIFLGETHGNAVDVEVARRTLLSPPIGLQGKTGVIFERLLNDRYQFGFPIEYHRTEKVDVARGRKERSQDLAEMIADAFDEDHAQVVLYVVCGSAHSREIYDSLNKRMKSPFTFISKPSDTD